jgi:transposase-like protein
MSTFVTPVAPELRSQIIASIKGGMSIAQAAETHQLSPKTLSKWMRQMSSNTHATTNELQKAKKQIAFLEHVILGLVLEQKSQIYKG